MARTPLPKVISYFDDEGLMAVGDSPTIARRRVRLALREARERADHTQFQVAAEMEWSLSKVIRNEIGGDLRSLGPAVDADRSTATQRAPKRGVALLAGRATVSPHPSTPSTATQKGRHEEPTEEERAP